MRADIAVVVVNFNSGDYLAGCIDALRSQSSDLPAADVIVVDNASTRDQRDWLAGAAGRGARVFPREVNDGYAGGCNFGLGVTDAPLVCFMNADVRLCPDALATLQRHLVEHREVGITEPRFFVDDGRHWMQPAFTPPTWSKLSWEAAARRWRTIAHRLELAGIRRQVRGWRSQEIRTCPALSGALLFTRRDVMERVGGFDLGYPLAYEDNDLFARVRAAGFTLTTVPRAEAIHYAHRSRVTVLEESIRKDALGRQRYLRQHVGAFANWLDQLWHSRADRGDGLWPRFSDLGPSRDPVELKLEGAPGPFVLLLAYDRSFAVYAGHFGEGTSYRFSLETWRSLLPSSVFVRALALGDLAPRGAWRFQPAADWPRGNLTSS